MPKYIIDFIYKGGRSLDGFSENGMTLSVYRVGRRCASYTKLTKLGEVSGLNEEAFWPDTVLYAKAQYLIQQQGNMGTYVLPNEKMDVLTPHKIYSEFLTDDNRIRCTYKAWPTKWGEGKQK